MIFDIIWSNPITYLSSISGDIATWVEWTSFWCAVSCQKFFKHEFWKLCETVLHRNFSLNYFISSIYWQSCYRIVLIAPHPIGKWNKRYFICCNRKQVLMANDTYEYPWFTIYSLHAYSFIRIRVTRSYRDHDFLYILIKNEKERQSYWTFLFHFYFSEDYLKWISIQRPLPTIYGWSNYSFPLSMNHYEETNKFCV